MRTGALGWGLTLVTALFTVVAAVAYIASGEFSRGWLYASAIVYVTVAAVCIALLVAKAMGREPGPATPPASATTGEPLLKEKTLIYQTSIGEAWRLEYAWPDGRSEIRHVATAEGEMVTHREIVARVEDLSAKLTPDVDITAYADALPRTPGARVDVDAIDQAISRHARHDAPPREPRDP